LYQLLLVTLLLMVITIASLDWGLLLTHLPGHLGGGLGGDFGALLLGDLGALLGGHLLTALLGN
jgi:hypothetical protein